MSASVALNPRAVARHAGTRALRAVLEGTVNHAPPRFSERFTAQGKAAGKNAVGAWAPASRANGKAQNQATWSPAARAQGKAPAV